VSAFAIAVTSQDEDGLRLFRFIPGYDQHIVLAGKETLVLILLAFLLTFALTRLYTRLARAYGWGSGSVHGVHLHHMVVGIIMVLATGLIALAAPPGEPWFDVVGIAFGVGAALTLDEFALWLYFRDVYWSEEGRVSIDAMIMGLVLAGLLLVGTTPFGFHQEEVEVPRAVAFAVLAGSVAFTAVTFLKGRLLLGLISVFVPVVAVVCALRLAKPRSAWARWFYDNHPDRLARSTDRFDERDARLKQLKDRVYDLIGGTPSPARRPREHGEPPKIVHGRLTAGDAAGADPPPDASARGRVGPERPARGL
jgi:hypothetical protein